MGKHAYIILERSIKYISGRACKNIRVQQQLLLQELLPCHVQLQEDHLHAGDDHACAGHLLVLGTGRQHPPDHL